jgi:aldose 1-epimerase
MIALERNGVSCGLDPELGGALLSLSVNGINLLRPAPSKPRDILETACFPLVPFANRIADGRMVFEGRQIVLPPDPAALPHAHHGHGWRRPWRLVHKGDVSAVVELRHDPDAWPWAYAATQEVTLVDGGAEVELSVRNLSDRPMPAGLGLHPYFFRGEADVIRLEARRIVTNSRGGIPIGEELFVPGEKSLTELDGLDNLLIDDSGGVRLGLSGVDHVLTAQGAVGFHVYVPKGEGFFCVEPVTHLPNAFAADADKHALAPGDTRRLSMRLTIN